MTVGAEHDVTDANRRAWNAQRYEAWLSAFESPKAEAARIIADPERILRRLSPYLGQVADKRIRNVQGSHGRVAVALAALRAEVMVIDFSAENRRFALELAAAAEVTVDYAVCDVLKAADLSGLTTLMCSCLSSEFSIIIRILICFLRLCASLQYAAAYLF